MPNVQVTGEAFRDLTFAGWQFYKAGNQTLNGTVVIDITWQSAKIDSNGYKSGNSALIPAGKAGKYRITIRGHIQPSLNVTGLTIWILKNGTVKSQTYYPVATAHPEFSILCSFLIDLAVGDGISIQMVSAIADSTLVSDGTEYYTSFEGTYFGP